MSNNSPSIGGDIVSTEMRVFLFLNLLRVLIGSSVNQNVLGVKEGLA